MRTIRLSFQYRSAIFGVLVFAGLFSASRYMRTWLAKPVLDEIIVPSGQMGFDLSAIAPRLWEVGTILGLAPDNLYPKTLVPAPSALGLLALGGLLGGRRRRVG